MCHKGFTELHLFEQHKYKQHGLGNPVACEKCGKELTGKASLDKHLLGCGVPKTIPCQEEQCQKKFKTTQGMQQHYRVWHTEVGKKFICEKCGLQLSSKLNLERHMPRHRFDGPPNEQEQDIEDEEEDSEEEDQEEEE